MNKTVNTTLESTLSSSSTDTIVVTCDTVYSFHEPIMRYAVTSALAAAVRALAKHDLDTAVDIVQSECCCTRNAATAFVKHLRES